jgi:hypothetical protein
VWTDISKGGERSERQVSMATTTPQSGLRSCRSVVNTREYLGGTDVQHHRLNLLCATITV